MKEGTERNKEKFIQLIQMDNINLEMDGLEEYFLFIYKFSNKLENYSFYQTKAFSLRGTLIDWLYNLNSKLKENPETLFKAINLMDEYLMNIKDKEIDKENFQLIGAVCYFISSKLKEVNNFSLHFLESTVLKYKFEKRTIIETELQILKNIRFRCEKPTIQNFSEIFLKLAENGLNHQKFNIMCKMNYFISLMTLLVEELIFDSSPWQISVICFLCTLKFLKAHRILKKSEIINVLEKINHFLIDLNLGKILADLENFAEALFSAILNEMDTKKRNFYYLYDECVSPILTSN